jgi:hypothetical protein
MPNDKLTKTKPRVILNMPRELIYGPQDTAIAVEEHPSTAKLPALREGITEVSTLRDLVDDRSPGGKIVRLPQFTSCALSDLFQS